VLASGLMPSSLRTNLRGLADSFAGAVLEAIRAASLDELLADGGTGRPGPGRPRRPGAEGYAAASTAGAPRKGRRASGRLARRSPEQIAKVLDGVVALVKKHKGGLRAEQIRSELGMQAKEMPRVLSEGLSKKKLKRRGRKRATTYTAA
jgi:hypothetical protein